MKISKKQRAALRQIDDLREKRKRQLILGTISIVVMIILIAGYNLLAYELEIIDASNMALRAMLYITAMVIAGYCGIMYMKASQNQRKIDGFRQSTGISRETLDAWIKGEFE